jgi:hypothetical protein
MHLRFSCGLPPSAVQCFWVTVLAAGKNGAALLGESFAKDKAVFAALLFLFLPSLAAIALPFLPPLAQLREAGATATGVMTFVAGLVVSILSWSSRNLLSLGAGRQTAEPGLLFLALAFVLGGSIGYLVLNDSKDESQVGGIAWYGIFVAVLVVLLYVNYAVIPDSIIPPPEYIRQRLGWMD